MREIKFRAWDKTTKKMFESGGTPSMLSGFFKQQSVGICMEFVVIMQYTGLKDKNGKEIYDGDILESIFPHNIKDLQAVTYTYGCFSPFSGYDELSTDYKIIGNIYENKELLK